MDHFLDTVETIPPGFGFSLFSPLHLVWLAIGSIVILLSCRYYRNADAVSRTRWRKIAASLLVADEVFKMIMLTIGGNYMLKYLPFHLCSINIFLIAIHAWKPSKLLGDFLYLVCIPGAIAALLFPTWTSLPLNNFMHLHSFTVHILLTLYPVVLTAGGDIRPRGRDFFKCLLLLAIMAVPIFFINLLCDTNFMFLMYAEPGNPLEWFQNACGNHLIGFPVLIAAIMAVMYVPTRFMHKKRIKA